MILVKDMRSERTKKLAQLIALTVLGVLLTAAKFVLSALPNIELVSLLLLCYTYKFGIKALLPAYVFAFLEIIIYGMNLWNIMYLYVWAVLVLVALPFRKIRRAWVFGLVSGIFGLLFGVLCSIPYWFAFSPSFAVSWIISGFTFDLVHGIANFAVALILYIPITKALEKVDI